MTLIKQIENDIKNNTFSPIYLLMGEEEYYIDYLTKLIQKSSLKDHEKDFNLNIDYLPKIKVNYLTEINI